MIGAFGAYYAAQFFKIETPSFFNFTIGLMAALLVSGLAGYLVEKFAYKPLRRTDKLNVLITAIGVSILFQFGGQIIFGANPKRFPSLIDDVNLFTIFESTINLVDTMIYVVTIISLVALTYLINKTQTGRAMQAVSSRPDMSPLMGINTDRIITFNRASAAAMKPA